MTTYSAPKPAGTPTWIDLATPDLDAARAFYKAVFGWDYNIGGPEFGGYTTALLGQRNAAGIGGNTSSDGTVFPTAWSVYFASHDIEADVARAVELGAQPMFPAMAVGEFGHMAGLIDPGGAMFYFWQAGQHIGAEVIDEPGSATWFELFASNAKQSRDFYAALLGATVGLMLASGDNFRLVFALAIIPAILSVVTLAVFVPEDGATPKSPEFPLSRSAAREMPREFWIVVALGAALAAVRVAEAFLVLRATALGLDSAYAPLVLVAMSLVYGLGAYPAGALSDGASPRAMVVAALLTLCAADACLAFATTLPLVFCGVALWGAHMALSQGLFAKLVADAAPRTLRGTAFGLFNVASAIALVIGNSLFGIVWSARGAHVAYAVAAVAALGVALAAFVALRPHAQAD